MDRENVSLGNSLKFLNKIDNARRKWGLHFYGIDPSDPNLYDLVYFIDNISVDDVVENIIDTVKRPCFQIFGIVGVCSL